MDYRVIIPTDKSVILKELGIDDIYADEKTMKKRIELHEKGYSLSEILAFEIDNNEAV